jgi:hypothetical protein
MHIPFDYAHGRVSTALDLTRVASVISTGGAAEVEKSACT